MWMILSQGFPCIYMHSPKVTCTHITCTFCLTQIISITYPKCRVCWRFSAVHNMHVSVNCNKEYFANWDEHMWSNGNDDDDMGVTHCILKDCTYLFSKWGWRKLFWNALYQQTEKERRRQSQDYLPWLLDLSRRSTPCDTYTYRTDTSLFTKYFQTHWIILIRMHHIFSWSMNLILNLSMRKRWIIMSVSIRNVWLLFLIVMVVMSVQCTLC